MPYIPKKEGRRTALKGGKGTAFDVGELNFQLTQLVKANRYLQGRLPRLILSRVTRYLDRLRVIQGKVGYADFNGVLGVFDAAQREHDDRGWWHGRGHDRETGTIPSVFEDAARRFYCGVVAPYEELKIEENGDL